MVENILLRDGLQTGTSIEVLSAQGKPLFLGRINALKEGTAEVTLAGENGAPLPAGVGGTPVRLRVKLSTNRMALYTGTVTLGSRIFWRISQLEGGPIQNRREFYRQAVSVEAFVMCFLKADGSPADSASPALCTILDISGGGLRLRCQENFSVGDQLFIMEVSLLEEEDPFDFSCQVRRVEEGEEFHGYGCQFEGLSDQEQTRLIQAINQLQKLRPG